MSTPNALLHRPASFDLNRLRTATERGDIELARKIIDLASEWAEMQSAISLLEEMRADGRAEAAHLLGNIHSRYERVDEAVVCYLQAAELGLPSGYYLAAEELRLSGGAPIHGMKKYDEFIAKGAEHGHLWATLVKRRASAHSSIRDRISFFLHRFLVWPLQIFSSNILGFNRDRTRF